ncbi:hypothetical protein GDO78_011865 [Eleutherodactylus coqui]|uniref:Uncharacterized protein n=1 Tax=Eleutherodactylus coqui TaxID=57060 RepID=A0A8J6F475_ELECQ|nr:hypothetical protein GDO78_011865 [Eleutherodactylus coqui]
MQHLFLYLVVFHLDSIDTVSYTNIRFLLILCKEIRLHLTRPASVFRICMGPLRKWSLPFIFLAVYLYAIHIKAKKDKKNTSCFIHFYMPADFEVNGVRKNQKDT